MYGKGVLAKDPKQAGDLAGQFRGKPLMAERARPAWTSSSARGLSILARRRDRLLLRRSTVQALAYSGAPLAGIVSFHGG